MFTSRHLLPGCRRLAILMLPVPSGVLLHASPMLWDPGVTGGRNPGGSGLFTGQPDQRVWWNGSANVAWTDTTGTTIAVLDAPALPAPPPSEYVVTVPEGVSLTAHGLTFAADGYTVSGPGQLNFRSDPLLSLGPPLITVPTGITGTFAAANNQSGPEVPAITIRGGGNLLWAAASAGSKLTIEEGTVVETAGSSQVLGDGTTTLTNGILRFGPGRHDRISDRARFAGSDSTEEAMGILDLNGSTETIGSISGNFKILNAGSQSALVSLAGDGTAIFTGTILDHPETPAITTGLKLTGSTASPGAATDVLNQRIGRPQTYSGPTLLHRGSLILDFNHPANPETNDLLYHGLEDLPSEDQRGFLIFSGNSDAGGPDGSGGRAVLTLIGKSGVAVSQRFRSTILEEGASAGLNFMMPGGAPSPAGGVLDLGPIDRSAGAVLNISTLNPSLVTVKTPTGTAGDVISDNGVPWMTVGGSHWVAKDDTNTVLAAASAQYTPAGPTSLAGHANLVSGTDVRLTADANIRSLRHNLTERRGVDLNGHDLTAGAFLIGPATAITGSHVAGGTLTSPGDEFVLVHTAGGNFRYFGFGADFKDHPEIPAGFTKTGTGGTFLTGSNTASGPMTVAQGTLIVTGSHHPSSILIQGNTTNTNYGQLPVNNPAINLLQLGNSNDAGSLGPKSPTGQVPITIGSLAAFAIKRTDDILLRNRINGAGNLIQAGTGTTILDAPSNHYAWLGDTIVSAGTLKLDFTLSDDGKIPDRSTLRTGGGTVVMEGGAAVDEVGSLALSPGFSKITRSPGSNARLRLNAIGGNGTGTAPGSTGSTLDFGEPLLATTTTGNTQGILGASARLTVGGSDWAMADSTDAGPEGAGITAFKDYQPLETGEGTDSSHSALETSGSLSGKRTTRSLRLSGNGGPLELEIEDSSPLTLTTGGLLITGGQAVSLSGGSLRSGIPTEPELIIHQFSPEPATLATTLQPGSPSAGLSHLTYSGPGTTIPTGTNIYGGTTFIHGGTVVASSNDQLGGANGTIGIASSATNSAIVQLSPGPLPQGFGIGSRLLGQTVEHLSENTATLRGNATVSLTDATAAFATAGPIVLNGGTLHVLQSFSLSETNTGGTGGIMTQHRPLILNGPGGTIHTALNQTLTSAGPTSGPGGLTKSGEGTLLLPTALAHNATGPTLIAEGVIQCGTSNSLGFFSDYTIAAGATLDLNGNFPGSVQTIGSLAGQGTVTNSGGFYSTLITGANFNPTVFSGSFTDGTAPLGLSKIGSGRMTLTGSSAFTGRTTIEAGTLILANPTGSATGTGEIFVSRIATLSGTGTAAGNALIHGTLAPGNTSTIPTGTLTIEGDITFQPDSLLRLEIGGSIPGTYDRLQTAQSLHFTSGQEIEVLFLPEYTPAAGHSFDFIGALFYNALDVSLVLPPLPAGLVWNVTEFSNDGSLSISPDGNLYQVWLETHFYPVELLDPTISGADADPDSDGLANAIEFATGTDPVDPSSGGPALLPDPSLVDGGDGRTYPALTFTAKTSHLYGIAITGQAGTDALTWPENLIETARTAHPDGSTTLVFQSTVPVSDASGSRRLLRLRFTPNP